MSETNIGKPVDSKISKSPQETTETEPKILTSVSVINETKIRKEEFALPQTPIVKLTRQQLYDEIWEISVSGLAKKYGISYSQLMKQVKKANIPIPPSGYWTILAYGKPVTKLELTEPFDEVVSLFEAAPATQKVKPKKAAKPEIVAKPMQEIEDDDDKPAPVATPRDKIITEAETASSIQTAPEPVTVKQNGQTYNVYNRDSLYKEVWEAPVTEVAKRYQVSDVAIHKVCKALEIPTPPAGYWAKIRAGKPVTVIPLPKSDSAKQKTGLRTDDACNSDAEKEKLTFLSEEDRSIVLAVASQILLPDEGTRMHSQIIAYRKAIAERKKQGRVNGNGGWNGQNSKSEPLLIDSISGEAFPRACRIIDVLIKAMEPLGCSLTNNLSFVVNGETVLLSFSEFQDRTDHVPTKEENMQLLEYEEKRKRYSWASKPQIRKYDYNYNGRLSLKVNDQKYFRDCKSYVIEDRLGDIMIELYEVAETLKKEREAREEAERRRQEEERLKEERRKQYNAEVDRTLALTNLSEDYDTACKIRRYIAVVEASEISSSETAEWIEWAKSKADWYDPTVAKEDQFFGTREHGNDAEKKKLQYKGYRW